MKHFELLFLQKIQIVKKKKGILSIGCYHKNILCFLKLTKASVDINAHANETVSELNTFTPSSVKSATVLYSCFVQQSIHEESAKPIM